MSDHMELTQENLEAIGSHVKGRLLDWLREVGPLEVVRTDPRLLERMVRVEEELKSQRELMKQGFEQVDRRFEEQREDMNKRFEELRADTNERFKTTYRLLSIGFVLLAVHMSVYEFIG